MLEHYITYRREVVRRRTEFDLARAQERAHILEGLKIALDNLDEVIATIRAAADVDAARAGLIKKFTLTEVQANAILEMQLRRLAALERKKIEDEYKAIIKLIGELEDLLANPRKILQVIKDELADLEKRYGDDRKTRIQADANRELTAEDLVAAEDVVVTLSQRGYIKRQPIGDVPLPAARRARQARHDHARGGCRAPPAGGEHPRQHPLLHEPRAGLHHQGPHAARCVAPGQGPADHQPARRPGRPARVRQRDHQPPAVRAGPLPGHGHATRARSRRPRWPTTRRSAPTA